MAQSSTEGRSTIAVDVNSNTPYFQSNQINHRGPAILRPGPNWRPNAIRHEGRASVRREQTHTPYFPINQINHCGPRPRCFSLESIIFRQSSKYDCPRWQMDTISATTQTPNANKARAINAWRRVVHSQPRANGCQGHPPLHFPPLHCSGRSANALPLGEMCLQQDDYRTNFATIGAWIDREFGAGDLFTNFLGHARDALHSFTHAGVSQLGRRFDGHNLVPTYDDDEIIEVIRVTTSAVWMATNLVTKHLGFAAEAAKAEQLYLEWGKH
jgi:hypothetical protein